LWGGIIRNLSDRADSWCIAEGLRDCSISVCKELTVAFCYFALQMESGGISKWDSVWPIPCAIAWTSSQILERIYQLGVVLFHKLGCHFSPNSLVILTNSIVFLFSRVFLIFAPN